MDGINVTPQRLLEDLPQGLDLAWLLPAGRPASRGASLFLHRDLNDHALRKPPAQSFSPAELEQAKQEGFEAGLQAGLNAAAASREVAEAATLDMVARLLVDARAASAAATDQAGAVLAQALVSAMGAIMPDLVRRSGLGEAGAMLTQVLAGLSREPDVRVEVRPELADGVTALVGRLAPELSNRVTVQGLDRLAAGEVLVRWSAGHARRQPGAVWQAVMDRLEPVLDPVLDVEAVRQSEGPVMVPSRGGSHDE
jgi:flagellar biosynthesis/type III secretory pathway protein FliH